MELVLKAEEIRSELIAVSAAVGEGQRPGPCTELEKLIPEILYITLVDDPRRSELAYTISNGKSDESSGRERLVIIQLSETCNEVTVLLCMCVGREE